MNENGTSCFERLVLRQAPQSEHPKIKALKENKHRIRLQTQTDQQLNSRHPRIEERLAELILVGSPKILNSLSISVFLCHFSK